MARFLFSTLAFEYKISLRGSVLSRSFHIKRLTSPVHPLTIFPIIQLEYDNVKEGAEEERESESNETGMKRRDAAGVVETKKEG